ncbi:hypothetical protein SAMN05216350_1101 [Polaromonas sp. YR568]|nr:hypothetical protein SAMN05216350_1101 [Polaromonas sp. YR568]
MDEVIRTSDLVMSRHEDIAMRAMLSGVPVVTPLVGQPRVTDGKAVRHAMGLLCDSDGEAALQSVAGLARAWSSSHDTAEKWQNFYIRWDAVQLRANALARRLHQLPNLSLTMTELVDEHAMHAAC